MIPVVSMHVSPWQQWIFFDWFLFVLDICKERLSFKEGNHDSNSDDEVTDGDLVERFESIIC